MLATATLGSAAGVGAAAETAPAATREGRATITLASIDPAVATPDTRVTVAGSLRNTGGSRLTEGEVRLRLSRMRLNSRSELAAAAAGQTSSTNGEIVGRQELGRPLAAGQQAAFQLSADSWNAAC